MKKIIFGITSLGLGGAERVLVDLANRLSKDYDITIFMIYDGGELKKELDPKIRKVALYRKKYEELTKIDVLADEIETLLNQSLDLNDKKQCKICSTLIGKDDKYCYNCGAKQEDENQTAQDNEDQMTIEEIKQDEDKTNLEKTVEVESHVNPDADGTIDIKDEGYDEDNEDEIDDEEN